MKACVKLYFVQNYESDFFYKSDFDAVVRG